MKRFFLVLAPTLVAAAFLVPAFASADISSNGSFEIGADPGAYATLNASDNTSITNWSVDSGSVDYIGTYWQAAVGARSIDLNGLAQGSISQSLPTTAGTEYNVTFDLSGNPDSSADPSLSSPSLKDVLVSATGATSQHFTFDTSSMNNTEANMMWQPETYSFTATGANTTLTFASQIAGAFGPALDNVAVNAEAPVTPTCTQTGFFRDGINMTAAVIDPASPVTGNVDATGCNVGVYFGPGTTGSVTGANIHGANYYGVVAQQAVVNVTNSTINQIGENPLNGDQHGIGIYFATIAGLANTDCTAGATTGTISGNTVTNYQKTGIEAACAGSNVTISNNAVTGQGPVDYIAQNGIEVLYGATAAITGNNVSGNEYSGSGSTAECGSNPPGGPNPICDTQSVGVLLYQAGDGVSISGTNVISGNDVGIYNLLSGSGATTISNNTLTGNRYAGMELDQGNANISGNTITGSDIGIAALSFGNDTANTLGTITNNTITGASDTGIKLLNDGTGSNYEPLIVAHGNDLSGNTHGVQNLLVTTVADATDATGNWWGAANGPIDPTSADGSTPDTNPGGTGSPAVGAVNYGGFCANAGCTTPLGSIKITKYVCPADTVVTRAANGVELTVPPGCAADSGKTFGYVHGTQTDANAPYPELGGPFSLGGATDSSGVLTISNLPATGRYLIAEIDGSNTQLPASSILGLYCQGDGDTSGTNDNQELTFVPADGTAQCVAYDPAAPAPISPQVHIFKYVDGVQATANNSTATFPMNASWVSSTLGTVPSVGFTLSPIGWGPTDVAYEASYVGGAAGDNYATNEVLGGPVVGDSCDGTHTFSLLGYSTGATLADAQAVVPSLTPPSFTNLQSDEYVIVWNTTCPTTASLTITKSSIGGNGTFNFTSNIPGHTSFSITTTSHTGSMTFSGLTPGSYTVTEVNQPKGWTQTDNSCTADALTLAAGADVNCVVTDTNNKLLGSIRGTKYEDRDGDGTLKDGDHHKLAGVTINLANASAPSVVIASAVTNKQGLYDFTGLVAGTYNVCEVSPDGWTQTYPKGNNGCYTITLSAGQNAKKKDFGNFQPGTISGMKYNDANGNGKKDNGEVGLSGWTIQLKKGNTVVATAPTGSDGSYKFTGLAAGTYTLSEVIPPASLAWHQTQHPGTVQIQSGTNAKNENFGNTQRPKDKDGDYDGDNGNNNNHH